MKKLLLFTALASFSFASAQVTTNAGTFNKPAEGDKSGLSLNGVAPNIFNDLLQVKNTWRGGWSGNHIMITARQNLACRPTSHFE